METERGNAIRARRAALLMTQDDFAKAIGVTRPTVSKWENGGEIQISHARRLVELGVPREAFIPTTKATPAKTVAA